MNPDCKWYWQQLMDCIPVILVNTPASLENKQAMMDYKLD
jgi:hypothetical protein